MNDLSPESTRAKRTYLFEDEAAPAQDLAPVDCRFRYVVCSLQRTGSSLLCRALQDTGLAGQPREFLHPRMAKAFIARMGQETMTTRELMAFLERHRSTPNGIFGTKAHLDQVRRANRTDEAVNRFLGHFDAAIFVYRRDKLMQAVSYERAIQTQVWEAEKAAEVAKARRSTVTYSADAIMRHLASFYEQERDWKALLKRAGTRMLPVAYEDLIADFAEQMHKVALFLGDPELARVEFQRPPHQKLSDDLSSDWANRFLADIRGHQAH